MFQNKPCDNALFPLQRVRAQQEDVLDYGARNGTTEVRDLEHREPHPLSEKVSNKVFQRLRHCQEKGLRDVLR